MQYEHRLERMRRELFESREAEVRRIEARKAKHVAQLLQAHEHAFADIKRYYTSIKHSNLDMIKSLKEEVHDLKRQEEMDEKKIVSIAQENKKLSVPLAQALEDARALRAEKEAYESDLIELRDTKVSIMELEAQLNTVRWEHEILTERHSRLERERDELRQRFTEALYEVQQKAGFRNLLLERRMEAAEVEVEKRGVQLAELLARVEDGSKAAEVRGRLDEVLETKEAAVAELRTELDRVVAAHNSALVAFASRLAERGVGPDELGFRPMAARDILRPLGLDSGPEAAMGTATAAAATGGGRARTAGQGSRAGGGPGAAAAAAAGASSGAGGMPRLGVSGRQRVRAYVPAQALAPSVAAGGPRAAAAAAAMSGAGH